MNIEAIIINIVAMIATAFGGSFLVSFATDWLKKANWFPWINGGQKGRILSLVAMFSAVLSIITVKGLGGEITQDMVQTLAVSIGTFLTALSGSQFWYNLFLKISGKEQSQ